MIWIGYSSQNCLFTLLHNAKIKWWKPYKGQNKHISNTGCASKFTAAYEELNLLLTNMASAVAGSAEKRRHWIHRLDITSALDLQRNRTKDHLNPSSDNTIVTTAAEATNSNSYSKQAGRRVGNERAHTEKEWNLLLLPSPNYNSQELWVRTNWLQQTGVTEDRGGSVFGGAVGSSQLEPREAI